MNTDEKWMKLALDEALLAENLGEVPVGAVIIKEEKLIAKAHNQPILKNDPSAHAEIEVMRLAGAEIKNYRLNNCTLYVTLEPCSMCFGAMVNARINRIVFGAFDTKKGVVGYSQDFRKSKCFNHNIIVTGGILNDKCSELMLNFFRTRRVRL